VDRAASSVFRIGSARKVRDEPADLALLIAIGDRDYLARAARERRYESRTRVRQVTSRTTNSRGDGYRTSVCTWTPDMNSHRYKHLGSVYILAFRHFASLGQVYVIQREVSDFVRSMNVSVDSCNSYYSLIYFTSQLEMFNNFVRLSIPVIFTEEEQNCK